MFVRLLPCRDVDDEPDRANSDGTISTNFPVSIVEVTPFTSMSSIKRWPVSPARLASIGDGFGRRNRAVRPAPSFTGTSANASVNTLSSAVASVESRTLTWIFPEAARVPAVSRNHRPRSSGTPVVSTVGGPSTVTVTEHTATTLISELPAAKVASPLYGR